MATLSQWQTGPMTFLRRYWFLLTSLIGLVLGLALPASINRIPFGAVALIGLVLSVRWAFEAVKHREFGSDSLAILAIVSSALIGEWLAAAIISVMLASGRALEQWAEGNARRELHALLNRAPAMATVVTSGKQESLPVAAVLVGSTVQVLNGQVVPLDGTLLSQAVLDESALTGEAMPVTRLAGEVISSGVLNAGATFTLQTTSDYANSTYANLIRLVREASATNANRVRLANRIAVWFIPFAIALAALTWLVSGQVKFAVAVLVAATPCPLILAIPVALIAGISRAAKRGVIIKGGAALEQLAGVRAVLFDKTGTLTRGGLRVSQIEFATSVDRDWLMSATAAIEQQSPHVVAKALVDAASSFSSRNVEVTQVVEEHGIGISAVVDGQRVRIGQPGLSLPAWAKLSQSLLVAIEVNGELRAMVGIEDPIRDDAISTTEALRVLKIEKLILVSGDRRETAAKVAEQINADEFFAECSPSRKLEILRQKQSDFSNHVAAVGDGINDAPLLAGANVGIAMGARGATAASEAADVVIIEDSIFRVAVAIDVARGAAAKAMQAAGVGMTLAVFAMLAASFGILSPTSSAIAQEAIDTAAVLWALTPIRSYIGSRAR